MPEFKIQCDYSGKRKMKFFNDKGPKEYHKFLVINPEVIPDEYLYFGKDKKQKPCWIWILNDLLKEAGIEFAELSKATKGYKFVVNLGGKKVAKFSTNNSNKMVLKTKNYFENTVKKIGFWDNEDYFYKLNKDKKNPTKKTNNNPVQLENKNDWTRMLLFLFVYLILIMTIFSFWVIRWTNKKKKTIKIY